MTWLWAATDAGSVTRTYCSLLAHVMYERLFDVLRTKEQLGYAPTPVSPKLARLSTSCLFHLLFDSLATGSTSAVAFYSAWLLFPTARQPHLLPCRYTVSCDYIGTEGMLGFYLLVQR